MKVDIFKTYWGWMGIAATGRGVSAVVLPKPSRRVVEQELKRAGLAEPSYQESGATSAGNHVKAARAAIEAYLTGAQRNFALPLDLGDQPRFRRQVLGVLQRIPYGRVRSYGWVARQLGKPRATRAVGGACGANPVPLLVPCHRVVAADGSLGGFSGGLRIKKRLLRLENLGNGRVSAGQREKGRSYGLESLSSGSGPCGRNASWRVRG
jgi:methylated-DNA-[protein]-cysteine S-methyltransferase